MPRKKKSGAFNDPSVRAKALATRERNAKLREQKAEKPKTDKKRKKYVRRKPIQTDHLRQTRDPRVLAEQPTKATPQSPEGRAAIATARLLVQQACILLLTVE
jgi:hypothetical protein